MNRNRLRLRRLALALAVLFAARGGVSLVLRVQRVHDALRARLEQAFGRPVEVGRFDVSVWSGPRLEAHYVTVGDDPQFGYEFLLRADRLSAAPDWRALLRGRLLFYRFSFDRPSLNLVRGLDGRWNFVAWAAALRNFPASSAAPSSFPATGAGRVEGIDVSNGRINFKRGADKLPFALVAVNGRLSPAPDGRWSLALDAQPLRAGVTLQDAGTLHLTGLLPPAALSPAPADRTAPTPPAEFSLEWRRASLSDALRLLSGGDFGVRGSLEASLVGQGPRSAAAADAAQRSDGAASPSSEREVGDAADTGWKFSGTLRLADVHRWDLSLQPDLPALNLSLDAASSADRREWKLREIVLEARRSKLRGSAAFRLGDNQRASLRVVSASIHLDDLLAWYRAFHPGVRPGTWVDGYLGADVEFAGWPVGLVHATLATTGARLNVAGETSSLEIRRTVLEADSKGARLGETQLAVGDSAGVRFAVRANWTPGVPFEASLMGSTAHLAELSTAIAALGISPTAHPLRAEGSASVKLNWKGFVSPWRLATSGTLALEDVALTGGLLRSGISVGKARLDFLPGQRRLQVSAAKAFGATWAGSFRAPTLAGPWEFSLSADRLNPPSLVRGFASEPPENSSLLSRILPAQAAATLAREEPYWPAWLRGEGTLAAEELDVGRLAFERLKGRLILGERGIAIEGAEAAAYGGRVRGEVRADFGEQPRYAVRAEFDGINVASLAAVAVSTRQCCTGTASGRVELNAAGWNRDALLASLSGTGRAEVHSGALLTLDFPATLGEGALQPGRTAVRTSSAGISFAGGRVLLDRLTLELPSGAVEGKGSATYRGELDLRIASRDADPNAVRLRGTLAAPQAAPEEKRGP
ncbi:MAG TPA: AsmA-like C-terminal region-containing protein [Candidatus Acidoferrales bacterium]|nr:AsmA-like C-terminal region-containing protein [Candidatus Acidoferrales bacterium]